jgi:hypothetical protein
MTGTNLIEDLRLLTPPDHRWTFAAVLAALGALVLVLALRWLRRRQAAIPAARDSAVAPPWETALAELERLAPLLRPEASRDYALAATAILRGYIGARYGLRAPRLATEEFLAVAGRAAELPPAHRESLARFLACGDLFKFGRYTATSAELRQLHTAAVDFVLASRPSVPAGAPEVAS